MNLYKNLKNSFIFGVKVFLCVYVFFFFFVVVFLTFLGFSSHSILQTPTINIFGFIHKVYHKIASHIFCQ